jgi:hypothetical protein
MRLEYGLCGAASAKLEEQRSKGSDGKASDEIAAAARLHWNAHSGRAR